MLRQSFKIHLTLYTLVNVLLIGLWVVKQLTDSAGDLRFENERELELDGLSGTHTVYQVL